MSMVWRWHQRYAPLSGGHGVSDVDVVSNIYYVVSGVSGSFGGISNAAGGGGSGGEVDALAGVSTSEAIFLVMCDPSMNKL